MTKRNRPAVDRMIAPGHGVSRDGQPLSYNRAPAADLASWIGRLYAIKVFAPDDYRLECGVLNDTAVIHLDLAGQWTAGTGADMRSWSATTLCSGPHTRRIPVSVTGSFMGVGYSLRPGAASALTGVRTADLLDRAFTPQELGQPCAWSAREFDLDAPPERWLQIMEKGFREWLAREPRREPDPISSRFENVAFTDPSIGVAAFAADCGVGERTVERIVRRDFGMPPKQVLRRARALDMASHLRGVADDAEAEELALRYYDQSHLIREFTELFGMSPTQFVKAPQPLLTLGLELRQSRRLEATERLSPGAIRPWQ